jgi:hypothetical protein
MDEAQDPKNDAARQAPAIGGFLRRHPALTVLGAASIGVLGGAEMVAGVVLGAGVAALLGRAPHAHAAREHHRIRDRVSRASERARAIVHAALGDEPRAHDAPPANP